MAIHDLRKQSGNKTTLQPQALFKYRWEALTLEIQAIQNIIARMDTFTQTTKNWAIVSWAGAIGLLLGQRGMSQFIILTAILPIIFWFLDAQWRYLETRSIYRLRMISEFIKDEKSLQSLGKPLMEGFLILDPVGRQHKDSENYKVFVRRSQTFWYKEVYVMYLSLSFLSIVLGIVACMGWLPEARTK